MGNNGFQDWKLTPISLGFFGDGGPITKLSHRSGTAREVIFSSPSRRFVPRCRQAGVLPIRYRKAGTRPTTPACHVLARVEH